MAHLLFFTRAFGLGPLVRRVRELVGQRAVPHLMVGFEVRVSGFGLLHMARFIIGPPRHPPNIHARGAVRVD